MLKIAEKRREVKDKGEKERYLSECRVQRIARRDKKAFVTDQCKQIEENNRMEKKIRDLKGTFHAKMDTRKKWYGCNRSRRY